MDSSRVNSESLKRIAVTPIILIDPTQRPDYIQLTSKYMEQQRLKQEVLNQLNSPGRIDRIHSKTREKYSFLVAVRTAALGSVSPLPPTWETYYRVFRMFRYTLSLDLCMESFNLLTELNKCYPRVYLNHSDSLGTDCSGGEKLMVKKEAWSPFTFDSENLYDEATTPCSDQESLIDSTCFSVLLEDIKCESYDSVKHFSALVEDIKCGSYHSLKIIKKMLLFQYLVRVLEDDYLSHQTEYNRTLNRNILWESVISMLLASREMNYRNLVHNCMSIASKIFNEINISFDDLKGTESTSADLSQSCNVGPSYVFPEFRKKTCVAAQKFLILIMELDLFLKVTENSSFTSRAPILEIIIDKLTYSGDYIFRFFEVFGEPKWKLEMILLYLSKYCKKEFYKIKKESLDDCTEAEFLTPEFKKIKKEYPDDCTEPKFLTPPTTDTRRTKDSPNDVTLQSIFNFFSNPTISCGILREVTSKVALFLLAQAFKCYLSLQPDPKNALFLTRMIGESTLLEVCGGLISTFSCITKLDRTFPLTSVQMEVVFVAKSIRRKMSPAGEILKKF